MKTTKDAIVAANRESWNEAAGHHRAHAQYAALLAGIATPGFSVLDDTLTGRLLGLGLAGKAVAQLCCNNARELLSVKNLGASSVTGFDFAAAFLDQARELAAAGASEAAFVFRSRTSPTFAPSPTAATTASTTGPTRTMPRGPATGPSTR